MLMINGNAEAFLLSIVELEEWIVGWKSDILFQLYVKIELFIFDSDTMLMVLCFSLCGHNFYISFYGMILVKSYFNIVTISLLN